MSRRMAALIVAAASLVVAVPVSAAPASTIQMQGASLWASFSNFPEDKEAIPPGEYFYTDVFAAEVLEAGTGEPVSDHACVYHYAFTIDENGEWSGEEGIWACGEVDVLVIDRRLSSGHLVASFPVTGCEAWDEESGECTAPIELGDLEIDLVLTGVGSVERLRGVQSGGSAGNYAYVYHGAGTRRDGTPSGTVTLDGASLVDGATAETGGISRVSQGYVEVSIGG